MRVDEFRRELADLAVQIPPYGNDVRGVRRTLARRRLITASVVVVVLALAAAGTIAATHTTHRHVEIIAPHPSKQVTPSQLELSGDDALVVIEKNADSDTPTRTHQTLEHLDTVDRYTQLPWGVDPTVTPGVLAPALQLIQQQGAATSAVSVPPGSILSIIEHKVPAACGDLPANRVAFVVHLATRRDAVAQLRSALHPHIAVYSLGDYKAPNAELLANALGGPRSTCPATLARGRIGDYPWTFSASPPRFPFPQHPTPGPELGAVNAPSMTLDYHGELFFNGPDCPWCPIAWVFVATAKDGQGFLYGAVPDVITDVTTTGTGGPRLRTTSTKGDGADDHWKFFVVPLGRDRHDVTVTFLANGSVAGTATFTATDTAIGTPIH
jgi:hypothetical protein